MLSFSKAMRRWRLFRQVHMRPSTKPVSRQARHWYWGVTVRLGEVMLRQQPVVLRLQRQAPVLQSG